MNRNKLKTYAPKARREFIAAVTARAARYGITKSKIEPVTVQGDVALIAGKPFPKAVAEQRRKLEERIKLRGFEQVMEEAAYTWFNRFAAIRYMELHGYLDHGYRVLSHPEGKPQPEIIEHADHVDLPGLKRDQVVDLKLDGTKDEELYRLLLKAQCNALHAAMPFLFEKIDDETELLLPDNLLHSDSLIRRMVSEIEEADWREIEIIGWLYQFYISDKKDEVIGKVVKSEDIPAATQLFTPNWIVKYMVQNSLGAQWLATYPDSPLKAKMDYYIEPAEQTDEVRKQLAEITPQSLDPEALTLIDPASGSGHILVEAYDLFKEIYLERGYRLRDVPRLILEKNLYGLDIDDRAAQLSGFALLMKARADDRRILSADDPVNLNVLAIQESNGLDADKIAQALLPDGKFELVPTDDLLPETLSQPTLAAQEKSSVDKNGIEELIALFTDAKTFGSLISVPDQVIDKLPALEAALASPISRDLIKRQPQIDTKETLSPLLRQAKLLSFQYDCVVANPPYMGGKFMLSDLKKVLKETYAGGGNDIYCAFVLRGIQFAKTMISMITMETWMYVVSYADFRNSLLSKACFKNACHLPYEGKRPTAMGINFGTIAFSMHLLPIKDYFGSFCRQRYVNLNEHGQPKNISELKIGTYQKNSRSFEKIPTAPIAFDASDAILSIFDDYEPLGQDVPCKDGMTTGSNDSYVRFWSEIDLRRFNRPSGPQFTTSNERPWVAYSKGGDFRKWYGNNELVLFWGRDGNKIKSDNKSVVRNEKFYFREAITWTLLSNFGFGARYRDPGFAFDTNGKSAFPTILSLGTLAYLNSMLAKRLLGLINPTIAFQAGDIGRLPAPTRGLLEIAESKGDRACEIAKADWDAFEQSWDFRTNPLILHSESTHNLADSYRILSLQRQNSVSLLGQIEAENSQLFISNYNLESEIEIETPDVEMALNANPVYRYGKEITDDERTSRLLYDTITELLSYAVGCMMGRYSLEEEGVIYANANNEDFDSSRYSRFAADEDGIVPITDEEWFDDDASLRFAEFLRVAWPVETLNDNLKFVANSLVAKSGETPIDTIRRYLSRDFFKDHLKTYKKRPIYWLFSSGKEKAFEALVYLHRYNAGTLSRMRTEYVVPLQGRLSSRIEQLDASIASASSTAAATRIRKELERYKKKLAELVQYDEQLRHFADQRIELDLDDGVKVNYGKFGDLLAEVKAITGSKE